MKTQKWDSNSISDQSGRIAIVTGSSSGIGYETARVLAEKNAKVIIAVRNPNKGQAALEKIMQAHPQADVQVMIVDLANFESVKAFSAEFKKSFQKLDLLINNAGVMVPPYSKTANGFELQFGTNHLGHFLLTNELMNLLKATPGSRIVNVSSMAHKSGKINFDDLNWEKRKYRAWQAYGDSKIANLYFTMEMRRKLGSAEYPLVAAAHPGWTATDLQRNSTMAGSLNRFFAQGIDMGALPTLYAALAEDVKSGDYFGPSGFMEMTGYPKKVKTNKLAQNETIAKKLWDVSEELTGVEFAV